MEIFSLEDGDPRKEQGFKEFDQKNKTLTQNDALISIEPNHPYKNSIEAENSFTNLVDKVYE